MFEKYIENYGFIESENYIGKGTDGYVTSVTHTQTRQQFAVKVVQLSSPKANEHFINEAAIMMKLMKNQNVVKTKSFSINRKSQEGYIVMEKMDTDLLKYILAKGKLEEEEARHFFFQICSAIEFAHSKKIAHLDIKPDNCLIDLKTRQIKICDFFRSYQWEEEMISKHGDLITKEYRAPEVLSQHKYRIDKLDQWSAGVMLFTMVTGSFPFVATNDMSVRGYNVVIKNYESFLRQKMGVSHVCYDLLAQLLSQNPAERPSFKSILSHPFFTSC